MRAVAIILLLALAAVAVYGQVEEYTPAIMTKPSDSLKKPIIFAPTPASGTPDADAPIVGKVPENLKKSAISENIFSGVVEFEKSRTPQGCRCRRQLPEKYRYDTQYRRERAVNGTSPCGCPTPVKKPEDALPPVVAKLYPIRVNTTLNATAPCAAPAPVVQKIAPSYYPKRKGPKALAKAAALAAAPCLKNATEPAKPVTITPSFYPTAAERRARRKLRRERKRAAAAKKL